MNQIKPSPWLTMAYHGTTNFFGWTQVTLTGGATATHFVVYQAERDVREIFHGNIVGTLW
jgi:hypothetical protein